MTYPLAATGPVPEGGHKPVYKPQEDLSDWGLSLPRRYIPADANQPEPDLKIYVNPFYISFDYMDKPYRAYRKISRASKLRLHRVMRDIGYRVFRYKNENKTIFHLEVER